VIVIVCEKPTAPLPLELGRRDYLWTVDTLDMPMNYIESVWGASPHDVWAVGAGGTYQDRLWHYDGETWMAYNEEPILCAGRTLFGFAADDVWMGGQGGWLSGGGGIWHYDGTQWREHFVYDEPDAYDVQFTSLYGSSPTNLFACGYVGFFDGVTDSLRGFVVHYNGQRWQLVNRATWESEFSLIRTDNASVYVRSFGAQDTITFYNVTHRSFTEIYTLSRAEEESGNFSMIDGQVYFIIAKKIYRYIDGEFVQQFSVTHPEFGYQIYGRNAQDIFLRMQDGLAHYNGNDVQYLYTFPPESRASISPSPVLFKDEVFFPVWAPGLQQSNLVLHGTLQE